MKKNILKATLVATFALIAGYNVYTSQKSDVMSDLALANVEALAGDEIGKNNCYATICNKTCRMYKFESSRPCTCSLCK